MEPSRASVEKRKRIEAWLNPGMGCRALAHPQVAAVVQETMLKWDGDRYRLIAWCVMPNHVHAVLEPKASLSVILQSWKSFTGRWALARNAELGLGVPGRRFWMRETWDRYIRDERHFASVVAYIEANPVTAGLCGRPEDWRWSSASSRAGNTGYGTTSTLTNPRPSDGTGSTWDVVVSADASMTRSCPPSCNGAHEPRSSESSRR